MSDITLILYPERIPLPQTSRAFSRSHSLTCFLPSVPQGEIGLPGQQGEMGFQGDKVCVVMCDSSP